MKKSIIAMAICILLLCTFAPTAFADDDVRAAISISGETAPDSENGRWIIDVKKNVYYKQAGTEEWKLVDYDNNIKSISLTPGKYTFSLDATESADDLTIDSCDLWVGGVQMPKDFLITYDHINVKFNTQFNELSLSDDGDGLGNTIEGNYNGAAIYSKISINKIVVGSNILLMPQAVKDTDPLYGIYIEDNAQTGNLLIQGNNLSIKLSKTTKTPAIGIVAGDVSTTCVITIDVDSPNSEAICIKAKSLKVISDSITCTIKGIAEENIIAGNPDYCGIKLVNGLSINAKSHVTITIGEIVAAVNKMASGAVGLDVGGTIINNGTLKINTCPAVYGNSIGINTSSDITNSGEITVESFAYNTKQNAKAINMSGNGKIELSSGTINLTTDCIAGNMSGTQLNTAGVQVFDSYGKEIELDKTTSKWPETLFTGNSKLKIEGGKTIGVTAVNINGKTTDSISVEEGKTIKLNGTVLPANATDQTLTWSSTDETIATVSNDGTVTGVKASSTPVTIKAISNANNAMQAMATVTVTDKTSVTGIEISSPTSGDIYIGASRVFNKTVSPSTAVDQSVTWYSSNTNVATIDSTGKLTASAAGQTTVYAVSSNNIKSNEITVTVSALPTITLSKVSADPTFTSLTGTKTLEVTVSPSNDYINSNISWDIVGTAGICSIHETGNKLTEAVSPLNVGTTIVRAYAFKDKSNQKYVDFTVTVSSTGYIITKPSCNNSLIWYYDNKSASGIIDVETNIPKGMIKSITIGEVSVPITTTSTTGYCTLTDISGGTRIDISYNWLKANLPSKTVNYYLKVYYGTGTAECASKLLYVRSINDAPITGDKDMTLYSILACTSIVIMTGVITSYFLYKKKHKNEQ